jgi:hypothetical protein
MKKQVVLGFLFCFFVQYAIGQSFQRPKYLLPFGYDSTTNEVRQLAFLVGQKVLVLPICSGGLQDGYSFFYKQIPVFEDFEIENGEFKLKNVSLVFKPLLRKPLQTDKKALENKNFDVVGIEKVAIPKMQGKDFYVLKLVGEDKTILYYGYPLNKARHEVYPPFITYGFHEKYSQKWKNKIIVATSEQHFSDFETGKAVVIAKKEELQIIKMMISPINPCLYGVVGFLAKPKGRNNQIFISLETLEVDSHRTSPETLPKICPFLPLEIQNKLNISKKEWDSFFENGSVEGISSEFLTEIYGVPAMIHASLSKSQKSVEYWEYGLTTVFVFVDNKMVQKR